MTLQEIIDELTKCDRLVIVEILLKRKYSRRYIDYMFSNGRKRTDLFRETVNAYWKSKLELTEKVEGFIHECNSKEEELV